MSSSEAAPVLSTPDTHIFEDAAPLTDSSLLPRQSDEQLYLIYEIERTVDEIRQGSWKRIALQFPDHMLVDAPRVFQALAGGLFQARMRTLPKQSHESQGNSVTAEGDSNGAPPRVQIDRLPDEKQDIEESLYILADTSYGACCVDEVAAEHADADVVVHYGRSCLSPTARLAVIYIFTRPPLDLKPMFEAYKETFPQRDGKVILMADIPYCGYVQDFADMLQHEGYSNIFVTSVIHDIASPLPNRTVPPEVSQDVTSLQSYQLFHVSDPPPSLLLTLSSRVGAIYIYPTNSTNEVAQSKTLLANSAAALRRRYALVTRISTAPIIGILINTLSVKFYLDVLNQLKQHIAAAGKKSYTFVVGKVNAAKVANFSEVGGWVVIGCWESSLFDNSEFWKPVITPWELELALKRDESRVWTGAWRSDFKAVLDPRQDLAQHGTMPDGDYDDRATAELNTERVEQSKAVGEDDDYSEEESEPPEFDLRTGRYVSHTRPMSTRTAASGNVSNGRSTSESLIKRPKGDLATIGGEISPAADFFRNNRSWQGLGSDFEMKYEEDGALKLEEAATVEAGRRGIARGYVMGDGEMEGSKR